MTIEVRKISHSTISLKYWMYMRRGFPRASTCHEIWSKTFSKLTKSTDTEPDRTQQPSIYLWVRWVMNLHQTQHPTTINLCVIHFEQQR